MIKGRAKNSTKCVLIDIEFQTVINIYHRSCRDCIDSGQTTRFEKFMQHQFSGSFCGTLGFERIKRKAKFKVNCRLKKCKEIGKYLIPFYH